MKRVLIIADVSNLYYTIAANFNGGKLDFALLYDECRKYGEIYRAVAYGAARGIEADKFKTALRRIGFEPKYKEPKIYLKPFGEQDSKADWDVGMAMDMVRYVDCYDTVVLCTADGDLAPCVEWLQSKGKFVVVFGVRISGDLKEVAYEWREISYEMLNTAEPSAVRTDVSSDAVRPGT